MQAKFNCIGEVRALGMMVAMELVKNRRADVPDAELTKALVQAAGRRGLILLSCGIYSNVIRILAPLTIPEAQLEEGLGLLEQSLAEATQAPGDGRRLTMDAATPPISRQPNQGRAD